MKKIYYYNKLYLIIFISIILIVIYFFNNNEQFNNVKLFEKQELNNSINNLIEDNKIMELIQQNMIKNSENIQVKINSLIYKTKIITNKKIEYAFIFDNYIYYKEDLEDVDPLDKEITKRLEIINVFNIKNDNNYFLNIGIANHNFRLFRFNNNIYGIGGQAFGIRSYNRDLINTENNLYIDYHKESNIFIDSSEYGISSLAGDKIYNPNIISPYYANGLHLFIFNDIKNNLFELENNGLPILSGIIDGRHDGHYGTCNFNNIDVSKNGLTVYDSQTSILYKDNKYYLYQRANICAGVRYIQYSTSEDLINWSEFNLLKINPEINHFEYNFYYSNFFKIKGVNNFIGILPCEHIIDDYEYNYKLYYSNDCINWNYIGIIGEGKYYNNWIVVGEPIYFDNKYYFYISNNEDLSFEIYYFEKNRFSYVTYIEENLISKLEFKLMYFKEKNIKINFKTEDNGYIKIQLKDVNKNIIDGYSFDDFDIINENINEFEFDISWNNNNAIPAHNLYIEVEGINFNIYSINCNLVYN